MKQETKERSISALGALVLLLVFSVGILSAILGGAGVYRRLDRQNREAADRRTAALYLTNKVRQAPGPVETARFGDCQALLIYETAESGRFVTRIYCHEGWLMELFSAEDGEFSPEDGEKVLPLAGLSVDLTEGLLRLQLTDAQGVEETLLLSSRYREEALP